MKPLHAHSASLAATPDKSGRGQPYSKTLRNQETLAITRQRLGVRQSSAAFEVVPSLSSAVPAQAEPMSPEGAPDKCVRAPRYAHRPNRESPFGAWSLEFPWSLEFGIWNFSRPHRSCLRGVFLAFLCSLVTLPTTAQSLTDSQLSEIRFDQKLNSRISLDLQFRDENGTTVRLRNYFGKKPIILALGYYQCPMLCTLTFNGMIEGLNDMKWSIGDQFTVIHISIDPKETSALASAKKQTYLKRYGRGGSASGWHFLTGEESAIRQLADEVGFHFAYDPAVKQYAHPSGLVILTPDGMISKYFFGVKFPANELYASLQTASQRKVGSPIERLILLCFHYSPLHGRYGPLIITTLRILGLITLAAMTWFFTRMFRAENEKRESTAPLQNAAARSQASPDSARSWSAAVLCRFGFRGQRVQLRPHGSEGEAPQNHSTASHP